jgi:hypothetical protein
MKTPMDVMSIIWKLLDRGTSDAEILRVMTAYFEGDKKKAVKALKDARETGWVRSRPCLNIRS